MTPASTIVNYCQPSSTIVNHWQTSGIFASLGDNHHASVWPAPTIFTSTIVKEPIFASPGDPASTYVHLQVIWWPESTIFASTIVKESMFVSSDDPCVIYRCICKSFTTFKLLSESLALSIGDWWVAQDAVKSSFLQIPDLMTRVISHVRPMPRVFTFTFTWCASRWGPHLTWCAKDAMASPSTDPSGSVLVSHCNAMHCGSTGQVSESRITIDRFLQYPNNFGLFYFLMMGHSAADHLWWHA